MDNYKGTILIADDEERIRRMLKDLLKSYGYKVLEAKDGKESMDIFCKNNNKIDMILLDIMMPYKDGIEVLKDIRDISFVPIIMLTAKGEDYDQINGLKNGADDYVSKPFSPLLLVTRIETVLKRYKSFNNNIVSIGKVNIDDCKKQVVISGKEVELTRKEYDLLLFLVQNNGITLTRENILNSVWNYDFYGDPRTVDTHIKQLRAKLSSECDYIKTVRGIGYRFEVTQ